MDWIDRARKQREVDAEPKYGPIHPWTDKRCFRRETCEEILDALNYAQWSRQKGEIGWWKFKKINNSLRYTIHLLEISCEDSFCWRVEILRFEVRVPD